MLPESKFSLADLNKRKQFLTYLCVLHDIILTFILSIDLCIALYISLEIRSCIQVRVSSLELCNDSSKLL